MPNYACAVLRDALKFDAVREKLRRRSCEGKMHAVSLHLFLIFTMLATEAVTASGSSAVGKKDHGKSTTISAETTSGIALGGDPMTPTNALSGRDAPIDRLVYHVSAGPPGERLSVSLLLPREGDAQLDHVDELHGEAASTRAILPDETWRRQLFELAGALEKPVGQEESLPDGFVRRIEIVDGQGRTTKLRVGSRTSPAIRQLVEALDAWLARAGVRLGH